MRVRNLCPVLVAALLVPVGAQAQFPRVLRDKIGKVEDTANKFKDVEMTDEEEVKLGEDISGRLRSKYGVVQDQAVHRYVGLVGTIIALKSKRPSLPWRFIILDTDGVNAFAAPGGYIHITRGALSLMKSEAEVAGVLAHEIAHVTEMHTIRAIQKGKVVQMAANERSVSANPQLFRRLADEAYKVVFAGFGRADELDADDHGLVFAADTGYAPAGLSLFLQALKQRNSSSEGKQGLFASHPEMDERLTRLDAIVKEHKWNAGIDLRERFAKNITFKPVELVAIATEGEGAAGLAGGKKEEEKKEEPKKKGRFSLSRLSNPLGTGEDTKQSAEVTGSGGSRAVDKERMAKGGSNPNPVLVALLPGEIEAFRKTGQLR